MHKIVRIMYHHRKMSIHDQLLHIERESHAFKKMHAQDIWQAPARRCASIYLLLRTDTTLSLSTTFPHTIYWIVVQDGIRVSFETLCEM